jgi:hypothetical protein
MPSAPGSNGELVGAALRARQRKKRSVGCPKFAIALLGGDYFAAVHSWRGGAVRAVGKFWADAVDNVKALAGSRFKETDRSNN